MTTRRVLVLAGFAAFAFAVQAEAHEAVSCVPEYGRLDRAEVAWDAAEVEQVWNAPLPQDLLVTGGVDQRGWFRACRIPDDPDGLFEGEYRDRHTWYRGRFVLRAGDGGDLPENALDTHFVNYFEAGRGLVLFPVGDPEPPVRALVLEPIDPEGFATRPEPQQ